MLFFAMVQQSNLAIFHYLCYPYGITLVFKVLNNVDVLKSFNYYFVQYTKFLLFFYCIFRSRKPVGMII